MKPNRRQPFSTLLAKRFAFYFADETEGGCPKREAFMKWAWQAIKPFYYRAEIGLLLLPAEAAREYNRQYRGKDYATNVLSFEVEDDAVGLPEAVLRGDMVICPDVVRQEAAEQGKSPEAHFAHLTIHGVLHLMGYDHQNDAQADEMEALEIRVLNQLGYANPYADES